VHVMKDENKGVARCVHVMRLCMCNLIDSGKRGQGACAIAFLFRKLRGDKGISSGATQMVRARLNWSVRTDG
jgi:hypothetical protein